MSTDSLTKTQKAHLLGGGVDLLFGEEEDSGLSKTLRVSEIFERTSEVERLTVATDWVLLRVQVD